MIEYLSDTFFIYATLIGGIVAIAYAFVKKRRAK